MREFEGSLREMRANKALWGLWMEMFVGLLSGALLLFRVEESAKPALSELAVLLESPQQRSQKTALIFVPHLELCLSTLIVPARCCWHPLPTHWLCLPMEGLQSCMRAPSPMEELSTTHYTYQSHPPPTLTGLPARPLARSLTRSLPFLTHPLTHPLLRSLTNSLISSLTHELTLVVP